MPQYDYRCEKCNNQEDITHPITDDPKIPCPRCGVFMYRAIGKVEYIAKCTGFYGKGK